MTGNFKKYLYDKLRINPLHRILVAVSGGMDSVALLHLFKNTNIQTGVVHINFQLRGNESDSDEAFVKNLANNYDLPFYTKCFDTISFANEEGISIQMAARRLRYGLFSELAALHQWDFVATAHHLDDQIETFFINLLRGTGLGGLKGIPAKSGLIIRPLLPFYRSEIEEYVKLNHLDYREDSSNLKSDYLRNRIRQKLIPLLGELQPAFRKVMAGNLNHLSSAEAFFREAVAELTSEIVSRTESGIEISIPRLLGVRFPELLLHEILQEFGFSTVQTQLIWQALDAQPGKTFFTDTFRLIKDRNTLIVQAIADFKSIDNVFFIEKDTSEVFIPIHLQFHTQRRDFDFHPSADPNKAFLDFDKMNFPLTVRKWKQGDRFKPLGMKGRMKLSDFFVANKFSIAEKESVWLITDAADQIIWLIGYRIADHCRIESSTTMVYTIEWMNRF